MTPELFLTTRDINHEIINLEHPVHSAVDVQKACGCSLQQVLKALVFVSPQKSVVALVPGDRKVDVTKLCAAVGQYDLRMAKPQQVLALTDYEVGAVSPFNITKAVVVIDAHVLSLGSVIVGSGKHNSLIKCSAEDLRLATGSQIVDIT